MFGLMKIATHEAKLQEIIEEMGGSMAFRQYFHGETAVECAAFMRERFEERCTEVATLKAQLETMTADRDAWKQSESACNTRYEKLQSVNVALKARIAELEKPVPLPKRKPVGKASPVTETVKVPVKGKVK